MGNNRDRHLFINFLLRSSSVLRQITGGQIFLLPKEPLVFPDDAIEF